MRERLRALARWLPHEAAHEWFTPSLLDLEIAWSERRANATRGRRLVADTRLAVGAVLLWLECVRLAAPLAFERWRQHRSPTPSRSIRRREYAVMIARDVRHALRLFRLEPVFAGAAVLTLALGIGANTALFAIVEAVLLRPLPFVSDEVVVLRYRDTRTGVAKDFVALGDVIDLRARQQSFEAIVPYNATQGALFGEGDAIRVEGIAAGPDLFRALRVEPLRGRFFEPGDALEGAPETVVISHALWSTRFGSDPAIVGRSIQIGTSRRVVLGVAPKGFRFPPSANTDVIVPIPVPATPPEERRTWIHALARLRPGVSLERANSELAALSRQFQAEFPATNAGIEYDALSARDAMVGDTRRALLLLLGAVGFVLLIACANVGNLLIARSLARRDEMTIRLALGAGRARLAAQMLIEGLVLAAAGGLAGVLLAWRAAPALAGLVPQSRAIPGLADVSLNPSVLAFAVTASIAAALLFSGLAAFGLTGTTAAVASTRRMTMSAATRRAATAIVAAEVAIAALLLIGAGLTLRSVATLMATDPGFSPRNVLNLQLGLPPGRYTDQRARRDAFERLFAAVRAVPQVQAVGAAAVTPLTGNNWTVPLQRPEHPVPPGERPPDVGWQVASGGYFQALQIPLRAGRLFDERDGPDAPPVVIVSEALAARYFAGEPPIGRRVIVGGQQAEIVGLVGDIRRASLDDQPRADMYLPFDRDPGQGIGLFVRSAGDAAAALPSVQAALRRIEPNVVVFGARTMEEVAAESAATAGLAMRVLGGFAAVALLLAAVGIYGVMSYAVRRRTREIGTRLALGAARGDIIRLVLWHTTAVTGAGLVIGLIAGLAGARSLGSMLHGVPPWDPLVMAGAGGILLVTSLAAGYLPARRAANVDPARTLAAE